ncbi:uncharacterized protein LOC141610670 [Silene latifolia]|uniref:uncharacterized protein LOC141610670 n=1 Tax=Silene latifolia TaxID=37657 RepID=UPI003D7715D5
MNSVLNKTWVFRTEALNGTRNVTGGALCISRNGLIITVAHNLEIPNIHPTLYTFLARKRNDTEFRQLRLIAESSNFDLALLEVKDVNEDDDEEFDFYSFREEGVEVDINEGVIAFVHQNYHLFTEKHGITCYPFPKNVSHDFPDVSDTTALRYFWFPNEDTWTDQEYKTVDCVADRWDTSFMDLHPKLPLVQVAGFDDEPGSSGCPFFKIQDEKLIGLAVISKDNFQYLLPVDLLRAFANSHAEIDENDRHVRQESESESESESE